MKKKKFKNLVLKKTVISNLKGGVSTFEDVTGPYTETCTEYDCGGNTATITCDWQCQGMTLHYCHTIVGCHSKWPANCG